jgi:mycofactocin system glycosyltransferase
MSDGFGLVLDPSVRSLRDGTVLVGGHPGRLIVLSRPGADALGAWIEGGRPTESTLRLGRRLVVAGLAHPVAPEAAGADGGGGIDGADPPRVTVVVPTRDRSEPLDRCLRSLGPGSPIVVVDDGSEDPDALGEVCARHGATLLHRDVNGGPGAARNDALPSVTTELVAFVDSDCEVSQGWLADLVWMFADPELAAVAPRVRPRASGPRADRSVLDRYSDHRSALDMGTERSEVGRGRAVSYLPTAALVVRMAALGDGFDERLRVGEDVDLVWRLLADGWRVRYEPAVTVSHREPTSWIGLLARHFHYGTSAAPLSRRHPGQLAPVELRPWPTGVTVAVLARRPAAALALLAGSTLSLTRQVRRFGVPTALALRWSVEGAAWTAVGLGRALTELWGPALVAGALRNRKWAITAAALVAVPPMVEWWRRHPALDPVRWSLASVADDMAYGTGVWWGCIRDRTVGPLVPRVRLRSVDGVPPRKAGPEEVTPPEVDGV